MKIKMISLVFAFLMAMTGGVRANFLEDRTFGDSVVGRAKEAYEDLVDKIKGLGENSWDNLCEGADAFRTWMGSVIEDAQDGWKDLKPWREGASEVLQKGAVWTKDVLIPGVSQFLDMLGYSMQGLQDYVDGGHYFEGPKATLASSPFWLLFKGVQGVSFVLGGAVSAGKSSMKAFQVNHSTT